MPELDEKLLVESGAVSALNTKKRHVLMVASSLPFPPSNGYKMRLWALLNCLTAEGCSTDLVCFGDAAELDRHGEDLFRLCRRIDAIPHQTASLSAKVNLRGRVAALLSKYPYAVATSRSAPMRARIESLLCASAYDMVLMEETNLLANLPRELNAPLVVDHHNAEHVLLERYVAHAENSAKALYARLEARKVRRWEREATKRASAVLVCSDHDRSRFRRIAPQARVLVAPNVIDAGAYVPAFDDDEENYTVLYAGGMDWYPNRDAVRHFVQDILPRLRLLIPEVEFVVAGRAPSPEFKREFADVAGMRFTGTLPDLRPEIANAAACVVPLRIGSGTRLKILEAAALGKAIVSTSIGAEGLEFVNGEEIVLADAPSEFAEAVASLLINASRRRRLGCAARASLERKYSLPALREALHGMWSAVEV